MLMALESLQPDGLLSFTMMLPDETVSQVTVTLFVPLPLVMLPPLIVQEYVSPELLVVEYVLEDNAHTVDEPETDGAGLALIFTLVVIVELVQEPSCVYTLYTPVSASVTEDLVGFCDDDEKLFGPDHT